MTGKILKTHHDYNVFPDNEAEIPEAVNEESDETAAERFVSQFKPATDAPTNSKFYKDAQMYPPSLYSYIDDQILEIVTTNFGYNARRFQQHPSTPRRH